MMMGGKNVWIRYFIKGPECVCTWQVGFFFFFWLKQKRWGEMIWHIPSNKKWSNAVWYETLTVEYYKGPEDSHLTGNNHFRGPSMNRAGTLLFLLQFLFLFISFWLKGGVERRKNFRVRELHFVSGCNERTYSWEWWDVRHFEFYKSPEPVYFAWK